MNQEQQRTELWGLLGDLPARERPISARLLWQREEAGYVLERLVLDLNGLESVPAYFARPKGDDPFPTVLYNHAHGGDYDLGKEEFVRGRPLLQQPPYVEALTAQGYAALCIEHWLFGERRGRTESELFKLMLWRGQVLWGMMVYDSVRALDYLCTRPEVDASRIATLGLSLGSTMAWWVAALDLRIKVCIDLCCLTDFDALIESRGLDGHGIYYYVPSLLKHFTAAQINALIAPRPHLGLAGNLDPLTPRAGLDRIDAELRRVYAEHNAANAWTMKRYEIGHFETAEMRAEVLAYLKAWL
ncbi:MAG: acetylxylan esterase [Caldilinea sp.]|uniref:dienelactone hydrolase family protein n=1 Tax=Caldilinea sp. TaxID=2293560 RepID=UPI002BF640FF|nr:acetylxylan esterase [Anaerolineales bacterium]HQY92023.1 acetylxylan esterase [Caldilinea sp.]HRA64485.1 acetylxylan esterase [Caldilinea sp.]